jgi:hypothetical protein
MRDSRASVLAFSAAVCLSAALACHSAAVAAAKVKSHSNTNNNRIFDSACSSGGGKVSITDSQSVCVLPSIAVKGEGVPDRLLEACVKDGGKVGQNNGATTCVGH